MRSEKIRKKFIDFFLKNKHKLVESSSLWPKDDASVLLTTAGMQQFKPFFLGIRDPQIDLNSKIFVSSQRCFRTSDIDEVGDATHATFFEMLGNFSVGAYFKDEAINLAWKFLTKEMHLNTKKLWATYYNGDKNVKTDSETVKIWKKFLPENRIIGNGAHDNWWGPPGKSGPCGPCSEIHYDFTGQPCVKKEKCLPNCECGRFMELWNLVFMEYYLDESGKLRKLPSKNIDTGMGLERLALIMQKKRNIFETDLYQDLLGKIRGNKIFGQVNEIEDLIRARILSDHIKGSIFLLADGVNFSNKEQGYILRRIFRRALDQFQLSNIDLNFIFELVDLVISQYAENFEYLDNRRQDILDQIKIEFDQYSKVLKLDIESLVKKIKSENTEKQTGDQPGPSGRDLSPREAFVLYTTYGLSPDRLKKIGFNFNASEFEKEVEKHQAISRAGAQKKFGGHGLNSSELSPEQKSKMTRFHTATHLLHQALRQVLGETVKQEGSDINYERLRFDFDYPQKLSQDQINQVEKIVNDIIKKNLPVTFEKMPLPEAVKLGALAFFKEKYPENVTVYSIGDFSKEICGGPHVKNTSEIGEFKIISEKSSSSGVRRIKASVQP
jgi:alanyl-tRNA synthetase